MKRITYIYLFCLLVTYASCTKETVDIYFKPAVTINFTNVGDSGIVVLDKGATSYNAKISINTQGTAINYFEIFQADTRTGARGNAIENTVSYFENGVPTYTTEFSIGNLSENRAIKVVVSDTTGSSYEKNLVLKITPAVWFSDVVKMETADNYYGSYFANWLSGRVYMRRHEQYKQEIDFSLGGVASGTDTIASLVSPAARQSLNLITMTGLQATKFEVTTLTEAQFNAISRVDASPITALNDPDKDTIPLANNKVFLYKTANGKKGLILVKGLARKSGTIEIEPNKWVPNSTYYQADISVKTVAP